MKGKKCNGGCGFLAVNRFYFTGFLSKKTGEKLRYGKCKKCMKNDQLLIRLRVNTLKRKLCVDEIHEIKKDNPYFFRKRVREALIKSGMKK